MSQTEIVNILRRFLVKSNARALEYAVYEHEKYGKEFLNHHAMNCPAVFCSTCCAWELSDYDTKSVQDAWNSLRDDEKH